METIDERFTKIEEIMEYATLVAWDGCHKIYIAMDAEEANWYMENYEDTYIGSPKEMTSMVKEWWNSSCGLRFISTTQNEDDGEVVFVPVIEQLEEFASA
jgi:hypothetical protein